MGTGESLTLKLKAWFKSRPKLDVGISATWFLLFFVYSHGLTMDDLSLDFYMSGILPVLRIPPLNMVMALLCLIVSAVVLVEPLLPSKLGGVDERG